MQNFNFLDCNYLDSTTVCWVKESTTVSENGQNFTFMQYFNFVQYFIQMTKDNKFNP